METEISMLTANRNTGYSKAIELAGGVNIASDVISGWENMYPELDVEWIRTTNGLERINKELKRRSRENLIPGGRIVL
jgi:transposase-like protein